MLLVALVIYLAQAWQILCSEIDVVCITVQSSNVLIMHVFDSVRNIYIGTDLFIDTNAHCN